MKKRVLWLWLAMLVVVTVLFGPSVFAGSKSAEAAAKTSIPIPNVGQYTWLPECLE
jgi:hypothetical protein